MFAVHGLIINSTYICIFSDEVMCDDDLEVSNIVPIAVGAALAALVVIVLIAYIIGRRTRKRGYESVWKVSPHPWPLVCSARANGGNCLLIPVSSYSCLPSHSSICEVHLRWIIEAQVFCLWWMSFSQQPLSSYARIYTLSSICSKFKQT